MTTASMPVLRAKVTGHLIQEWASHAGLTQADLAQALGICRRSVWSMEHGSRMPREGEILRMERALELSSEQRHWLRELTARHAPPPRTPRTAIAEVDQLIGYMDCLPYPAMLLDSCWDLHRANTAALSLWDWLRGPRSAQHNMLLRCLTVPEGRKRLPDWETSYARPLVAQLQLATIQAPRSRRLAELREAVLDGGQPHTREVLRRYWHEPDGRRLWLPPEVRVHLPAISPSPVVLRQQCFVLERSGLRLWVMEPLPARQAA